MFDIVKCSAAPSQYGFTAFYSPEQLKGKVIEAENLEAAAGHRNRKSLILLRDHSYDEGAMKLVAEKKQLCFLIDLGRLMRSRGVQRAILLSRLRTFLALCNRFGAFYSFATFAESELQVRNAGELIAIAGLLGINKGQAKFALGMLKHYV
jgi:RNase P/RNase MRP subunit p30